MTYDFRTLSPLDFENLVRDLLQADLRLTFESFGPGPDSGIDFRCSHHGYRTIIQAKHYAGSGFRALLRAAEAESSNIHRLRPKHYILATSVSLTPNRKDRLIERLDAPPRTLVEVRGREDLNSLLVKNPSVERAHFKLWLPSTTILDRVLHSKRYNRTAIELDQIREAVPRFVHNESVHSAEVILASYRTLIISGSPGVGKSTLARILIWLHMAQGWDVSVIDDINEAFEIEPGDRPHLIFFDDFLGQIQLSSEHIRGVDQRLSAMLRRIRIHKNLRFILTTRDYILNQAQEQSQRLSEATSGTSKLVLNIDVYTRPIRAKILFNHVYFSELAPRQKWRFIENDLYLSIIDHKNFNPRLVEVITSKGYVDAVENFTPEYVIEIFDNPATLWEKPFHAHISDASRILLYTIFFTHYEKVNDTELFRLLGLELGCPSHSLSVSSYHAALRELEGSFIAISNGYVRFANPGVRDYLSHIVSRYNVISAMLAFTDRADEVGVCWEAYSAERPPNVNRVQMGLLFAAAVARSEWRDFGLAWTMSIGVQLIAEFGERDFISFAEGIAKKFRDQDIDGEEFETIVEIMNVFQRVPHGNQQIDKIRHMVCSTVRAALFDLGGWLSLDQLAAIAGGLVEGGDGEADETAAAMCAAIERHVEAIDEYLDSFGTWKEVHEYRDGLIGLAMQFGFPHRRLLYYINEYEADYPDVLADRAEYQENEYNPVEAPTAGSDEYIRSMFSSLNDADDANQQGGRCLEHPEQEN